MIWHITKRELFDHINSLRFILTVVILSALMVTNAVVHLRTHPERVRNYSENVTKSLNKLKSRTQLHALAQKGPGNLYKRPSMLAFIADGGDAYLPGHIWNEGSWSKGSTGTLNKKQLVVELRQCESRCERFSSSGNKDRLGIYYHLPALLHSAFIHL